MAKIEWVEVDPAEYEPESDPIPDCPDGGFSSHLWDLTIEEGQITLVSGCESCDAAWEEAASQVGTEDVFMSQAVRCRLESRLETYGWETPEYDHWWDITPASASPEGDTP